ncbi:MAG: hypothetical protein LC624_11080 [Halobacteriales archaeon]|nr:hypothetical protein [Halobacteriales archaeon]
MKDSHWIVLGVGTFVALGALAALAGVGTPGGAGTTLVRGMSDAPSNVDLSVATYGADGVLIQAVTFRDLGGGTWGGQSETLRCGGMAELRAYATVSRTGESLGKEWFAPGSCGGTWHVKVSKGWDVETWHG